MWGGGVKNSDTIKNVPGILIDIYPIKPTDDKTRMKAILTNPAKKLVLLIWRHVLSEVSSKTQFLKRFVKTTLMQAALSG